MKDFIIKIFSQRRGIVCWVSLLTVVNLIIPFFYISQIEARLTIIAFLINFITGSLIYKIYGFKKILGLMHWAWIPLMIFLMIRFVYSPRLDLFGCWILAVIAFNNISLYFDIKDVVGFCQRRRELLN